MSADSLRAEAPIDDCWNRIGIRGDHSCDRLLRYIHCRNCPVHAQAAADLLDRITVIPSDPAATLEDSAVTGANVADAVGTDALDRAKEDVSAAQEAFLLFRVADEWFALAARFVSQVANASIIHSLPRVRSKDVLGLTNVRGQLTVCVSLARLLDLTAASPTSPPVGASTLNAAGGSRVPSASGAAGASSAFNASSADSVTSAHIGVGAIVARFIVARDVDTAAVRERRSEEITVFPVDEVYGIERFTRSAHRVVPATLAHASAAHTRSLLTWKERTVGVLDGTLLFETLRRSLG